jgi:hypothetical protein
MKRSRAGVLLLAIASTSQAHSADVAARHAAVESLKVCEAYGQGFIALPGTDTCLSISGYVRFSMGGGNESRDWAAAHYPSLTNARRYDTLGTQTRLRLNIDARSMTDIGLLRGYASVLAQTWSHDAQRIEAEKAFIQFGGWLAGRQTSSFDFFSGYATGLTFDADVHDDTVNQLSYTRLLGDGLTATLGIEDPTFAGRYDAHLTPVSGANDILYGGVKVPDVVGNINLTGKWGSAQAMAVLHRDNGSVSGNDGGWGEAVAAGLRLNAPALGQKDEVSVQAAYGKGAARYVSGEFGAATPMRLRGTTEPPLVYDMSESGAQSRAWAVIAGIRHYVSPTVRADFDASYASYDAGASNIVFTPDGETLERDLKQTTARGSVTWMPARNLSLSSAVSYRHTAFANPNLTGWNSWMVSMRAERTF